MPPAPRHLQQALQQHLYKPTSMVQGGTAHGKHIPLMPPLSQKCPFHSGALLARMADNSERVVPCKCACRVKHAMLQLQ